MPVGTTDLKADMALRCHPDQPAFAWLQPGRSSDGLAGGGGAIATLAVSGPVSAPSGWAEDGLVAVTAAGGSTAWAVGFTTIGNVTMPLAMRWDGSGWTVDRPRPDGRLDSMFTDVTMVEKFPFAVGYRMTASGGSQPIAARRDGTRWRYVDPRTDRFRSVGLTGVAPDGRGGLWIVGHGGRGTEISPIIYRRDDARWERQRTPESAARCPDRCRGRKPDDGWAVGCNRSMVGRCRSSSTGTAERGRGRRHRASTRTRSS
jgi:hypothetical protein